MIAIFSGLIVFNNPSYTQHCMFSHPGLRCLLLSPTTHHCYCITMTSYWARWRLKSPALRLFTQPFIQGADHRKHQSTASLAFVRGIHRWPVNSLHKRPATRKMFPSDDGIMVRIKTNHMVRVHDIFQSIDFIHTDRHQHQDDSASFYMYALNSILVLVRKSLGVHNNRISHGTVLHCTAV